MDKQAAITMLGGTPSAAAEAIGISQAAVSQWPDVLPPRIADRVQAALWRRSQRAAAEGAPRAPHEGAESAGQGVDVHEPSLPASTPEGNASQTTAGAI